VSVTDHQVATLRAFLARDFDEHKRLREQLDREGQVGWITLIAAGFVEAVQRRFANDNGDPVRYVGSVRARSDKLADEIDPQVAERLIRDVLKVGGPPDLDGKAKFAAQFHLLTAMVVDAKYDDTGLDDFLAKTRRLADQWLDERQ
jgi:hypothetical protein